MSSFWSSDYSSATTVSDPKRKFRFMVAMAGLMTTDAATNEMWFAKSCTKPSFQIATAEHKYLNHTFYFPGTVTWQDITLTLVDPGGTSDVAGMMTTLMETAGYGVPADSGYLGTITKASMAQAISSIVITQLDGEGAPTEAWTLHNALITEMKFGDLEYGADDLTEVTLTLKYDWATMTLTTAGVESDDAMAALPTGS